MLEPAAAGPLAAPVGGHHVHVEPAGLDPLAGVEQPSGLGVHEVARVIREGEARAGEPHPGAAFPDLGNGHHPRGGVPPGHRHHPAVGQHRHGRIPATERHLGQPRRPGFAHRIEDVGDAKPAVVVASARPTPSASRRPSACGPSRTACRAPRSPRPPVRRARRGIPQPRLGRRGRARLVLAPGQHLPGRQEGHVERHDVPRHRRVPLAGSSPRGGARSAPRWPRSTDGPPVLKRSVCGPVPAIPRSRNLAVPPPFVVMASLPCRVPEPLSDRGGDRHARHHHPVRVLHHDRRLPAGDPHLPVERPAGWLHADLDAGGRPGQHRHVRAGLPVGGGIVASTGDRPGRESGRKQQRASTTETSAHRRHEHDEGAPMHEPGPGPVGRCAWKSLINRNLRSAGPPGLPEPLRRPYGRPAAPPLLSISRV